MEKLLNGIKLLNDNVSVTYGPYGKNVIIRQFNEVKITKDGVTVANNTFSNDEEEQTGIDIIRQAANKSLEDSGDGTTTTIMLAYEAIKNNKLQNDYNINEFRKGAEDKLTEVCNLLDKYSVKDFNLESIANTSANGDKTISNIVTKVVEHCGASGIVEYRRSYYQDRFELKKGYTFQRGYLSSKFINDPETLKFSSNKNCKVLICNRKLENFDEVVPLFSNIKAKDTTLLIIAEDFSNKFLGMCLFNLEKGITIIPVKLPEYGEQRQAFLEDLNWYTGANITTKEFTEEDLGNCESFIIGKNETIILKNIDSKELNKQIKFIEKLLSKVESEFGKKKYKERIANLTGTNADIYINGVTDSEFDERKDLFDDAIKACQSSLKDGVLPGGGVALINLVLDFIKENSTPSKSNSYKAGEKMVYNLLYKPFEWLHGKNTETILSFLEGKDFMYTYNSKTQQYGLGTDINVLDSCKTVKSSLINAVSVALSILTSNLFINVNKQNE